MAPSSTTPAAPARRQARFAAAAILPHDVTPATWYDVCEGRRRDDDRPGMVLLDLGERRAHFPVSCLEFRQVTPEVPGDAIATGAARPRDDGGSAARPRDAGGTRTRAWRAKAAALSLVPLGAAALVAAYRLGASRA